MKKRRTKILRSFPTKKYRVIYADPPWPTGGAPGILTTDRINANNKYALMTKQQLLTLPVQSISEPDALLFLWSTWSMLNLAMACIQEWGFKYSTGAPWLKVQKDGVTPIFGMGIWFMGCTELLLVARKGRISNPRPARKGIFIAPRGRHSEKPHEVRDWIAEKIPGPRVELFARTQFEGWDCWGNEV